MAIINIHILTEPETNLAARQAQAVQEELAAAHRRGEHSYAGMKRRACPLCQAGK